MEGLTVGGVRVVAADGVYFRLFSSICNERQAPLYSQAAWEILSLSENCPITFLPTLTHCRERARTRWCPRPLLASLALSPPTYMRPGAGRGGGVSHLLSPEPQTTESLVKDEGGQGGSAAPE